MKEQNDRRIEGWGEAVEEIKRGRKRVSTDRRERQKEGRKEGE